MDFSNFLSASSDIALASMVVNLAISAGLSLVVGWHFVQFGSVFSNRLKFARVLLPIALTTTLVISVVKSSLALSLGLVGALSIVRFRTPVKEPEELAYLFMAIAIGLGTGANQILITIVAIILIMGFLTVRGLLRREGKYPNLYLNVSMPQPAHSASPLSGLVGDLTEFAAGADLRRYDIHDGTLHATFYLDIRDTVQLTQIETKLRDRYPDASLTFVEQSGFPGA